MNKDSSIRKMPEKEVFITIKLFDLAEPFQTGGVAKLQITQKAGISIEVNAFYTTHEMVNCLTCSINTTSILSIL